jgi:hypothetical protein
MKRKAKKQKLKKVKHALPANAWPDPRLNPHAPDKVAKLKALGATEVSVGLPSPPKPKHKEVAVGVYVNAAGRHAVVIRVVRGVCEVLHIGGGFVELTTMKQHAFTLEYREHLSGYPVRRAARIYMRSELSKTPDAERVLRALLASG